MAIVRPACQREWEEAMDLTWRIFLRYEADDYSEEGVENFWNFITDETLRRMFRLGIYQVFVAESDGKIIGVISLRDRTHISLLFVDDAWHRQGIGSQLVDYASDFVKNGLGEKTLTVNASPYGVPFYEAVGFVKQSEELTTDGIRYTPMKKMI